MTSQLDLEWSADYRHREWWLRILEVIRELVARASLKEVAFRLGVAPPALAHALAERDRHYPRMDWLPVLCDLAAELNMGERLANTIVAPIGFAAGPLQPMTPEQRLVLIEKALDRLGPALGALVRKEAGL